MTVVPAHHAAALLSLLLLSRGQGARVIIPVKLQWREERLSREEGATGGDEECIWEDQDDKATRENH